MANGLPCLNPTCDYEFTHTEIQSGGTLTCPRCGHVFQLAASAAPPAARPVPTAARAVPQAQRVAPPQPAAPVPLKPSDHFDVELVKPARPAAPPVATRTAAWAGEASAEPYDGSDAVVNSSVLQGQRPPIERWKMGLIAGCVIAAVIGLPVLIVLIVFFAGSFQPAGAVVGDRYMGDFFNVRRSPERAFQLLMPYNETHYDTWKRNDAFKKRLNATIALEREIVVGAEEPHTMWLAVAGQDYGHQKPRDSELLKRAIERLEKCFGENLALESQPEIEQLDGRPAQVIKFTGQLNSVEWWGYCYTFTHHGFGYWLFIAGNDGELAKQTFLDMQKQDGLGFRVMTNRGGWRSQPPPLETFAATDAPLRLSAPKAIWSAFPGTEEDKNGVLYLIGQDKKEGLVHDDPSRNIRTARILVIRLERQTEDLRQALEDGKTYVAESYKQEKDEYELKPIKDGAANESFLYPAGKERARVLEQKLVRTDGDWKYLLLAVVRRPDHIYIIRCDSYVEYHQAWRGEFLEILNTLEID